MSRTTVEGSGEMLLNTPNQNYQLHSSTTTVHLTANQITTSEVYLFGVAPFTVTVRWSQPKYLLIENQKSTNGILFSPERMETCHSDRFQHRKKSAVFSYSLGKVNILQKRSLETRERKVGLCGKGWKEVMWDTLS